ncbi:hypothetical protein PC128_g11529 [Phytophthora cactorum]|nr:hypothetical protein PC120_g8300 [Phytophthora cactorum]KAG3087628.1 hypothetical protein PC121_g4578 [Phytophthora cactorum]KAG3190014.1 hypothetical protein PC128_g11529 [Phytophthora cactorum]KAG4048605.1 hypothetical protein PC123_g16080 [Phytophthora cactorum]
MRQSWQVDEEHVKQQLRQEEQAWVADQRAAGHSTPLPLQFWSVGKLLRVVQASHSAVNPLETLAQYGITRHSVGSVDQRRAASQPSAADTQHVPSGDAVTYSSSRVWITGFLHFGENLDTCDILELCDSNSRLPSFLLDPSPQLVGQLVLVKRWVLVDKAFGGVRTAGSMFLEVHDKKPTILSPVNDSCVKWTQDHVLEVLERNYQTKDPPMYTGTERWTEIAAYSRGNTVNDPVLAGENDEQGKHKKRKRIHAVFGRVTSVSPISRQKDRASSHFFVEIECHRSCNEASTQSIVTVMFTGIDSMRWNLFLRPGKLVLLTDLVKVHSRECEMFLLQATHGHESSHSIESETDALKTSVLLWNELPSPQNSTGKLISDSLDTYTKSFISRCTGKLLDFEGQVCRLLWDECVELLGPEETRVIVCLFHFPYTHELVRLRKGTTVRVSDAHVLRWPTPVGGKLVVGLCPRSHLAVTSYGGPSGHCIAMGTRSRRGRAHKKWSSLGDFHRQSMVLSMWLLEVLELLDSKFFFGGAEEMHVKSSQLSFPRTRRHKAASFVAKKLGFSLGNGHDRAVTTLGGLFLKCHSPNAGNCTTVELPLREKLMACNRVLTIRELQKVGESKLKRMIESKSDLVDAADGVLSIRIPADDLDWCLLLGCIRGNIDSGDLKVYDRTGSISLRLDGGEMDMNLTGERGVHLFRNFEFGIENYNQGQELQQEERLPLVHCMSCSADNVEFVTIRDDETISFSPENAVPDAQDIQEVVLMVTHIGALPLSSIRSTRRLPEYRVLHAIVCPVGEKLQTDQFLKSVCTADILVSTQSSSWYVQKGGCYRIKAIESSKDDKTRSPSHYSVEDRAIGASINHLETSTEAKDSNTICFESLQHRSEECIGEKRPFRVYRVESVQNSIVPIKLECGEFKDVVCGVHEVCKQRDRYMSGLIMAPEWSGEEMVGALNAKLLAKQTPLEVTASELVAMNILRHFLQQSEMVTQVCSLLHHPIIIQSQQSADNGKIDEERSVVKTVDPNLHKPHLISVIGIITKKKYYWRSNGQQQLPHTATIGVKRIREGDSIAEGSRRQLACILHVRDLQHPDTIEIRVDTSRFGLLGTLQLNCVVELTRLQGFIARSSFKVYLNWSHFTAARLVPTLSVPRDGELYGVMPTMFLNDLYHTSHVDRMLHRYVVGVVHISYVVLKRKCGLCHQAMELNKRRGVWKHTESQPESKYSRNCAWKWHQMTPSDSAFKTRTYMGTTVRCVIDDGSGQAELFLENDVAWELLTCTAGQRQRFEDILSNYVAEMSYFSGRTANGSFATSKAERGQEYYQNELRAFVLSAIPSLRSMVVFAQRFYKAKEKEGTSVLTFGKDIHLTTKTVPQPKLEAKRVDRMHVRNELQQRLAQLRQRAQGIGGAARPCATVEQI